MSNIYTIHDAAAGYYMPIFLASTDAAAERMFIQSMGNQILHRADYTLFKIGSFDSEQGIVQDQTPELILQGLSIDPKYIPEPQTQKENI